jgi:hypothetical protein
MAAGWPTLADVRGLLRLSPDPTEDAYIDSARLAAIGYGDGKTNHQWPPQNPSTWTTPFPDACYQACLLHASRLYKRRDSLDGTLSWGDMGAVRVGKWDPDVDAMYSLIGPFAFG